MDEKFNYGLDVNVYLNKAVEVLKNQYHYHWADLSLFSKYYRYEIEQEENHYHYIRYTTFDDGDINREVLDINPDNFWDKVENGDDFIKVIVSNNEHHVYYSNKVISTYKVKFENGLEIDGGWYLERYEFKKHQTGDYSAFVQAGDRITGGFRDFFIPPYYLNGTYLQFLDQYELLVPKKDFGLAKEDLINDEGLKDFLGFNTSKIFKDDKGKVIFIYNNHIYRLTSHPYEPCLYINQEDKIIHVLHNAFEVNDMIDAFNKGETLRGINSKEYDKKAIIKVLETTIDSGRYEMNFTFADTLVKDEL